MIVDQPALFPYEGFALWVKDAITAGSIVNKLRIAEQERTIKTKEEHVFLLLVREETAYYSSTEVIILLPVGGKYPVLSSDGTQVVWAVLTAYLAGGARYSTLKESLQRFLHARPAIVQLLANMASCFDPALAPIE